MARLISSRRRLTGKSSAYVGQGRWARRLVITSGENFFIGIQLCTGANNSLTIKQFLAGGIVAFVYIICLAHFLISIKIHNDNSEQDIVTKLKEAMSTPCDDAFHFSDDETHLIEANELQDDEDYHYIGAIITTKPENITIQGIRTQQSYAGV